MELSAKVNHFLDLYSRHEEKMMNSEEDEIKSLIKEFADFFLSILFEFLVSMWVMCLPVVAILLRLISNPPPLPVLVR